jgi:Carbohydrate esterase, sialic acid-specific acetylesterase
LASGDGPYVNIVREAQTELGLPNVKYVDAFGLNLARDHVHLTTKSQVQLGIMLADSYLNSGINGIN